MYKPRRTVKKKSCKAFPNKYDGITGWFGRKVHWINLFSSKNKNKKTCPSLPLTLKSVNGNLKVKNVYLSFPDISMRTSPTRTETERPTKPEKMESKKEETKRVCFLFIMLITKKKTQSGRECFFSIFEWSSGLFGYNLLATVWKISGVNGLINIHVQWCK